MSNIKVKKVVNNLVGVLGNRAGDIVLQRFGIGDSNDIKTLEAIGKNYSITRERVRQIENASLNAIRQSDVFISAEPILEELRSAIDYHGGVVAEHDLLERVAKDGKERNHVLFLLVLGDNFKRLREDDHFHHRWTTEDERIEKAHKILHRLHKEIKKGDTFAEEEIVSLLKKYVDEELKSDFNQEIINAMLGISKLVDKNPLGEWGHVHSPNIRPRGMRDLAYLVLRKQGSPMHFVEVSGKISDLFEKKAHPATVHNELIKDNRFILVGRGLYALDDWGYSSGTVKSVIKNILEKNGPLSKEDIIKSVLKERYVKENTILVNLQNRKCFKRDSSGCYSIV